MARNTSVPLGEHFSDFVDEQIKDGRFSNVSEVVRAGLRLLEDAETKQRVLREALLAGEASGPAVSLDWDEFRSASEPSTGELRVPWTCPRG